MKKLIPLALATLGVGFILLGTVLGEQTVVWRKAINICMECIGLG